jgi:hypothetical protein
MEDNCAIQSEFAHSALQSQPAVLARTTITITSGITGTTTLVAGSGYTKLLMVLILYKLVVVVVVDVQEHLQVVVVVLHQFQ